MWRAWNNLEDEDIIELWWILEEFKNPRNLNLGFLLNESEIAKVLMDLSSRRRSFVNSRYHFL